MKDQIDAGFNAISDKLDVKDQIDAGFNAISDKLDIKDQMEAGFNAISDKLDIKDQIEAGFDAISDKLDIKDQIEDVFNAISDKLGTAQLQVENLRKIAQKTLLLVGELKWREGLKRIEAYCKFIHQKGSLKTIITYIDSSFNFFVEIQTDATQHFDEEKLKEYMVFLVNEEGIQPCINFYNYVMALRCQFNTILTLYHCYKDEPYEVRFR